MFNGGELSVSTRPDRQMLNGVGPMADGGEHLGARQHDLHRPPGDPRRQRRERRVRPDAQSCAERAADERHQHTHACWINAECGRQRIAHRMRILRRVMDGQRIAVPDRDCGKQADWIVRVFGSGVGGLDLHVGGREGPRHVTAIVIGRPWMEDRRGSRVVEGEDRRVTLVCDLDQSGCRLRLLPGLRDDDCHVLAVMQNGVALERRQR